MTATLVSIIGPPAVGKTTLAQALCLELPAEMICEDFAGNPFLAESYTGDETSRLPAQVYYLISRVAQLRRSAWPQEGLVVSDYGYCQDRVFASTRLNPGEMAGYAALAEHLDPLVHPPEVLVHLDAAEQTLLNRMVARGRGFEQGITREFLTTLRNAYNDIERSAACCVLHVDCDCMDLREPAARAALIDRIRSAL